MPRTLLGPAHPSLPTGVELDDEGDRLVLRATEPATDLASGVFASPGAHVAFRVDELAGGPVEALGFAFTQFAMPVRTVLPAPFEFAPSSALASPPAVVPLLLRAGGTVTLLAPLDHVHDHVIGVVQDERHVTELRWGWHGDLDEVPDGYATTLGIYEGGSVAEVLTRWGAELQEAAGTRRLGRADSPLTEQLSYWTDNGAAYWYRTEPGLDLPTTLERKLDELRSAGVPIGAVELDSWFYPHETSRPVLEVGYTEQVPPTGMLEWTARSDVLPDGVDGLADRLGRPPLVLHSRHISTASPYLDEGEWWTELAAQPVDPRFFARWFDDAASWGATCIEQDWLLLYWWGTAELRRIPGRVREWQTTLDRLAAERDQTLLWCMATPADLIATVELGRIVAVRTSDDYRYADDPAFLWQWYLAVNALASALGLATFKDCSFTAGLEPGDEVIDGDPYPEVEAVLQALSAGVVGIGDRIGRTDADVVGRLLRPDGTLATSDTPVTVHERSAFRPWDADGELTWATAWCGAHHYVLALHAAATDAPISDGLDLDGEWLVYDWRSGTARPSGRVDAELDHRGWALFVCCPLSGATPDRSAVVGDPDRYVTMSGVVGDEPGLLRWTEGTGLTRS
ncbi:MAG: hypothetical protein AAGA99_05195 [Actinomycetota bacterium]